MKLRELIKELEALNTEENKDLEIVIPERYGNRVEELNWVEVKQTNVSTRNYIYKALKLTLGN